MRKQMIEASGVLHSIHWLSLNHHAKGQLQTNIRVEVLTRFCQV